MADRHQNSAQTQRAPRPSNLGCTFLRRFQEQAPKSTQVVGFLTLAVSGGILLLFAGLSVTAAIMGLILLTPLIVVSSPIWVPVGTLMFVSGAALMSMCAFGVALVAGTSWLYRYIKGFNPPGADQFDYARSRIYDTASHVKDYAWEYGGYLQSKVKDAAPGA